MEEVVNQLEALSLSNDKRRVKGQRKGKKKKNGNSRARDDHTVVIRGNKQRLKTSHHKNMPQFYDSAKTLGIFHDHKLYEMNRMDLFPQLKDPIAHIAKSTPAEKTQLVRPFLGISLYENHDKYSPMTAKELDTTEACSTYLDQYENSHGQKYGEDRDFVIVTARHHMIDLAILPFSRQFTNVNLLCAYTPGNLLEISQDPADNTNDKLGVNTDNPILKKICFSGFALEDILTESANDEERNPTFLIVENEIANTRLLMRCEIDAYNPITSHYTELKCYAKYNFGNPNHRRKLLKSWIQTGVIPTTDIVIGVRDTESGCLQDVRCYNRNLLYNKLISKSLPRCDSELNYDPAISVVWYRSLINTLTTTIASLLDKFGRDEPQLFSIKVDNNCNIRIEHRQNPK